ncbi:HK97 family phage prohead protease [Spartinivicinus ruber]|uniref:HK97 family phage prohead protease n=1 Tax=Spartinivicinus ruber TaxID=2683272 RepID=UPI0013D69332|nr:HK97 family phage prohead protease [Spartinivicinus ruber]
MKLTKIAKPFEIKSIDESGVFAGYGSVFDVEDSYGDVVEKGAFLQSLNQWQQKNKLPALLWQHRYDEPIGVYTKMMEDNHGLYVEGKLLIDDDPLAKRAYAHLKAGSVTGLSIGFTLPKGGGEWDEDTDTYRLKQVKLWEVSLVTFPANESATVDGVKSAIDGGPKTFERFLREAGLSRAQARGLMADGYHALNQRDAELSSTVNQLQSLIQTLKG